MDVPLIMQVSTLTQSKKKKTFGRLRVCSRGFSLFELLVVLALLSLTAAVVLPSFTTGMEGLRLNTEARKMVTKLKQTRSKAIAQQKVFRVVFPLSERESGKETTYAITDDYGIEIEKMALPKGFTLILETDLSPMVSFYPNGRSSGFRFLIESPRKNRLMVEVDTISGLAKARKLTKGTGL